MNTNDDILRRIDQLLPPLEDIVRGGKPEQYPPALYKQIKKMWDDGLIIESPGSYIVKPGEHGREIEMPDGTRIPLVKLKGVTTVHPISYELTIRRENIRKAAKAAYDGADVLNYKVLGLDPFYRRLQPTLSGENFIDPVEMCGDAAAFILTRSDFHGLRQALHILKAKLSGDPRVLGTRLIIQNTAGQFWNPILEYTGLNRMSESALEDLGIHITVNPGDPEHDGPDTTLHALRSMGARAKLPPKPDRDEAHIQPGDEILVASGQSHKSPEIDGIFSTMRARVKVLPLSSRIVVKPREAEEESRSFEGNDLEKLQSLHFRLHEMIDTYGEQFVISSLCPAGKKPSNIWVTFDDRGLYFKDRRIMETRAFDPIRKYLNPYNCKPQPGAELAFVLKTVSKYEFFHDMLGAARAEIEADPERYGNEPVDYTIVDTACYLFTRLDWLLEKGRPRYIASFGKTNSVAMENPKPENRIDQSDFFSAPRAFNPEDTPVEKLRSKAQVTNYTYTHSEMALALRAAGRIAGIEKHALLPAPCRQEFGEAVDGTGAPLRFHRLSSQFSFFPEIFGLGSRPMLRKVRKALNHTYKLTTGNNGQFRVPQPKTPPAHFERFGEKHRVEVDRALEKMRILYRESDGFLLVPDSERMKAMSGHKWLKTLFFFSLVVGKQVGDMAITNKLIAFCDWNAEKSWQDQLAIFHHLNKTPLLGDRLHLIASQPQNERELKNVLTEYKTKYVRPSISEKPVMDKDNNIPCPEDLYRVTVYCSASLSGSAEASMEARAFTYALAGSGFAVINGGGSQDTTMKETSEGVHQFREWWAKTFPEAPMPRNHIGSYQCHDTYEREGGWHPKNEYARILQTIEQRMSYLQNTDAEVLLAGGAGSIQEISASLYMRDLGLVPTKHRPLVIVNQKVGMHNAFDALIDMISPEERKRLNVHVVSTTAEALRIVKLARAAMRAEPDMGFLYVPGAVPAPAQGHRPLAGPASYVAA